MVFVGGLDAICESTPAKFQWALAQWLSPTNIEMYISLKSKVCESFTSQKLQPVQFAHIKNIPTEMAANSITPSKCQHNEARGISNAIYYKR